MIHLFRQSMTGQLLGALKMLRECISRCPEPDWHLPVVNVKFSHVAFHTVFFTDVYLGRDRESFRQQEFHQIHKKQFGVYEELEDCARNAVHAKDFVHLYLDHCRSKVVSVLQAETEKTLAQPAGFSWLKFSRLEVYPYNLRHIQHHAAQLSLHLRRTHQIDIPWIFGKEN